MTEAVITRSQARQLGLKFYFGKECPKGHGKIRDVNNWRCSVCNRQTKTQHAANNSEKVREAKRRYYYSNKSRYRASDAKRRAIKLAGTLPGYDEELQTIYKNCPEGYHVDHVIPLQGKTVCGLHVPWNLQYLTPVQNISKKNSW